MKFAIYPGSFDPVTSGHLNVIRRAANIFDRLVVCVMVNAVKHPMFTLEERVDMIRRVTEDLPNVEVEYSDGLLAEYAHSKGKCVIVKGLRAGSERVPDGAHQSQDQSGFGHHVPDGGASVYVPELQHGQGIGFL